MLKKLLKYDLKNIYKVLVVFYILVIFFAIFTRFMLYKDIAIIKIFGQVCSGITISMIISIIINNIMRLWARFYNNFYKDEAYLTHTLPISKKILFLSKFLTSVITILGSILVIILSLFIAYYTKDNYNLLLNMISFKTLILVIILFILEMVLLVLSGYFGILIGQSKNEKKMFKTVLYGFISYIVNQILFILVIFVVGVINKDVAVIFESNINNFTIINNLLSVGVWYYFILIIVYYYLCLYIFNKGVNIE